MLEVEVLQFKIERSVDDGNGAITPSGSFPAILRVESDMDGQDVQDRTFPSLHPVYPVHPCSISRFFNSEREQRIPTRNSSRNDPLGSV